MYAPPLAHAEPGSAATDPTMPARAMQRSTRISPPLRRVLSHKTDPRLHEFHRDAGTSGRPARSFSRGFAGRVRRTRERGGEDASEEPMAAVRDGGPRARRVHG